MSAPPVKTDISKVLNAITMMWQTLQMAMTAQMTSRTGPRPFKMDQPGKTTTRGRIDPGREQQALGVICAMRQLISSAVVPSWPSTPGLEKFLGMRRTFLYSATVTPFQMTQRTVHG